MASSSVNFGPGNIGLQAGTINGPVNTAIHLPPGRPETPPRPSIVIPFSRDANFVDRGDLLGQIHQKGSIPGSRAALVGLGGVGKSQLAIEYAYRTRNQSPETWVFWVHASNSARFEQSYREIADRVKIPGRRSEQANVIELVYDWLYDSKTPWVLILDSLDDAGFLNDPPGSDKRKPTRPLRAYLPHCQNGSILITTRNQQAALSLVEQHDTITVDVMSELDACALFKKKSKAEESDDDVARLVSALEFMPMAISQAAAYISLRSPRCSARQYLDKFKKSDRQKTSLLDHDEGQLRRDWEARNSIITTWEISFDYIRQARSSAADLLSLMSFFDRQGIPENLLRNRTMQLNLPRKQARPDTGILQGLSAVRSPEDQNKRWLSMVTKLKNVKVTHYLHDGCSCTSHDHNDDNIASQSSSGDESWETVSSGYNVSDTEPDENSPHHPSPNDEETEEASSSQSDSGNEEFEDDISTLRDFSFITANFNGKTFEMHALVQLATRKWLSAHGHLQRWNHQFIRNLAEAFLTEGKKNLETRRALFTHAKSAAEQHPEGKVAWIDWANVMCCAASYACEVSNGVEAEKMALPAAEICTVLLGWNHRRTTRAMTILKGSLDEQGRSELALPLAEHLMNRTKHEFGATHPAALSSIADLAITYWHQGRYAQAEELNLQVLDVSKKIYGVTHPFTLSVITNLASTYARQGRREEAEILNVYSLETTKKELGATHAETLIMMANLARLYWYQDRFGEAEELELQVLEARKKKLGLIHTDTLTIMSNLAMTYWSQGKLEEAEELNVQVLETRKKELGETHPHTLTSMANLAKLYWNQGRLGEAEDIEVKVLELRKKKFGATHPDTLVSMGNLATTWKVQGRHEDADSLMNECLQLRDRLLGIQEESE